MSTRLRFRVGDVAIVDFPAGPAEVRIVEDRGPLGVGGRRLVRVDLLSGDPDAPTSFELPEELLIEASPRRKRATARVRDLRATEES